MLRVSIGIENGIEHEDPMLSASISIEKGD